VLRAVQAGYAEAIVKALFLALAAVCISAPFAVGMEWRSVRVGEGERRERQEGASEKG
ncbi:MAG: hypothetical protein L6R41_004504, partial [Letrouitia leprolyta]